MRQAVTWLTRSVLERISEVRAELLQRGERGVHQRLALSIVRRIVLPQRTLALFTGIIELFP